MATRQALAARLNQLRCTLKRRQSHFAPLLEERKQGISGLFKTLKKQRYAALDSHTMKRWLNADLLPRGTSVQAASPTFGRLWEEAIPQHSGSADSIYEHKKVFHSTYDLAKQPTRKTDGIVVDEQGIQRQRYLVHEKTSTEGEATSHYTRFYPALPRKWDSDPLVRAVHRLFAEVFAEPKQLAMDVQLPAASVMFQFCYRTVLSLKNGMMKGDPGPEGVHVDGGTAAMVLVVRRDNIKPETGGTRIWSMEQRTGKSTPEDIASEKLIYTWYPTQPFEALFFLDESVLHEALWGDLIDEDSDGIRDMFIMDVRRTDGTWLGIQPVVKGE